MKDEEQSKRKWKASKLVCSLILFQDRPCVLCIPAAIFLLCQAKYLKIPLLTVRTYFMLLWGRLFLINPAEEKLFVQASIEWAGWK